ncbi:hypothetical protein L484_017685 [Morus notabilis]|uniref:Uncharacterized protein n=1 Tax=Morus notabilis TaxID=981085 RepID=W9SGK7_9ROSA|nr:uncharacterized membrane protein At3g27390 [Morus notabilis]XP_024031333.1 uncharacterized membrane protein At3g27390 [Morus notabilis]XP_024031334.1 uncharacterized membrane protein At3g27390 [Morus notabilis]EXC31402.1 hypothetical protein L484_017685 [Morus notabilis]
MEPPKGIWASLWNFIRFLPYFIGLLLLGHIKGIILCPVICLIMTAGNLAIILVLWLPHGVWAYYSILWAKKLGPVLKLVLCVSVLPILLILWPVVGILGSIVGGAAYGFLSPVMATFKAVEEGKTSKLYHCFYDGTVSTFKGCFTFIRDLKDVCHHSYFSVMNDLREQGPPNGKYYEIRILYLPGAVVAGVLGFIVDWPVISVIALFKGFYMLFKGWHRLFHDLVGREGPFLETICVPFAGLAILLWPLAVIGAVLASIVASIFLGAFAGAIVYQESSFWFGLCYIVASLAIYDEYSNDVLDMPEGSCFPRPCYRRKDALSRTTSRGSSFSRPGSFRNSQTGSMIDLKPLELLDSLFKECEHYGELLVSEGLISLQDIEDAKSGKGSSIIGTGLPAYCLLQTLIRSSKANSGGILLNDNTEINSTNRPKDVVFDWFLNPLLIIKEQIRAENLSEAEESYFCKLVLLSGDPSRLKDADIGPSPEPERKRAELDALARRLLGITKSISRYPTFRRRFEQLVRSLSDELEKNNGKRQTIQRSKSAKETIRRSKSAFAGLFSSKSFKFKTSNHGSDQESQVIAREVEIA